jgi:hypothetical protein
MPIWDVGSWFLTIESEGLRWLYHLRSASGSSGPIAKEKSPLLGWRPILILGAFLTLFSATSRLSASNLSRQLTSQQKIDALVTNA